MAGRRKGSGMPRRDQARTGRMRCRYEAELDPWLQLGWAYDWLRFELGHLARARVPGGREQAYALVREIAAELAARAQEVSERSDGK